MKKIILKIVFICALFSAWAQNGPKPKTTTAPGKTTTTKTVVTSAANTAKCVPINGIKPFAFTGSFVMNYTLNDNGKSQTGKIFYAFDCYQNCIIPTFDLKTAVEFKMRAVTDMSEKTITMLTEDKKGKKTGLIFNIPKKVIVSTDAKVKFTAQKTNETKLIEGFTCTKWIITGDNGTIINAWITDKINVNYKDMLNNIGQSFKGKSPFENSYAKEINGFSLETTITDAQTKSTTTITLSNIKQEKPDSKLFSTDGYSLMDARGLPIFGGQ